MTRFKRSFGSEMLPGFLDELWVKDIHHSKNPSRDEPEPDEDLIASIREKGVLQPIVVRPIEEGFEAIAGNRRLTACKSLGVKKVPCYVVGLDDKQAYEISLIENLQRRNLNPIEEARALKKYVDEYGYGGVSELARRIGKSEPYVSRRIALLDLPREIQDMVIRRRIVPSIAEELVRLNSSEMHQAAESLLTKPVTRSEVREAIKRMRTVDSSGGLHQFMEVEESLRIIERARSRSIASLKVCLMRMDQIINSLEEDSWFVRENLTYYRRTIHQFIDRIVALQKKSGMCEQLLAIETAEDDDPVEQDVSPRSLTTNH